MKLYLAGQIPIMLLILQSGLAELPPNEASVNSFHRLDAVHTLVCVEATEEDRQFLYETLSDPEPFIRRMSARALGNNIHEDNCTPLYDRLKVESVSYVKAALISALAKNECCADMDLIKTVLLGDSYYSVRSEGMVLLSRCSENGPKILMELLENSDRDLQNWASDTLSQNKLADVALIVPLFNSEDPGIRFAALSAIWGYPEEVIRPYLEQVRLLEQDPIRRIRKNASNLLKSYEEK